MFMSWSESELAKWIPILPSSILPIDRPRTAWGSAPVVAVHIRAREAGEDQQSLMWQGSSGEILLKDSGCLFDIGNYTQLNGDSGIVIIEYKDPYKLISIMECHRGFEKSLLVSGRIIDYVVWSQLK